MSDGNTYITHVFVAGRTQKKSRKHSCTRKASENTNSGSWEHDPNSCMKQLDQRGGKREEKQMILVMVAGIMPDVMRTHNPHHTITQGRRSAHVLTWCCVFGGPRCENLTDNVRNITGSYRTFVIKLQP